MKTSRLIRVVAMPESLRKEYVALQNGEGTCTCGRQLTALSPKYVLANAVSQHPTDPNLRECIILGVFCMSCNAQVNNVLKMLKQKPLSGGNGK